MDAVNKKIIMQYITCLLGVIWLVLPAYGQAEEEGGEGYWVPVSTEALIYSEPFVLSDTVASVAEGDTLFMVDEKDGYVQVRYDDQDGFINRFNLRMGERHKDFFEQRKTAHKKEEIEEDWQAFVEERRERIKREQELREKYLESVPTVPETRIEAASCVGTHSCRGVYHGEPAIFIYEAMWRQWVEMEGSDLAVRRTLKEAYPLGTYAGRVRIDRSVFHALVLDE